MPLDWFSRAIVHFRNVERTYTELLILARYKGCDPNVRSVWLCRGNDAIVLSNTMTLETKADP